MESKFRDGFVKNLVFYTMNDELMHNLAVVAIKDIYVILKICFMHLFLSALKLWLSVMEEEKEFRCRSIPRELIWAVFKE